MNKEAAEARFYLSCCLGFTIAAIVASSIMHSAGLSQSQTVSTVVTIMGFATLSVTQYRTAVQALSTGKQASLAAQNAALAVDGVRKTLRESLENSGMSLRKITENITVRLTEITDTTKATHELVNSQRLVLLEEHAKLWKRLADYTGKDSDRQSAELAMIAFDKNKEHQE